MNGYITGVVETIYFQNDSNFYKVLLVTIDETDLEFDNPTIVITGTFGQMHPETVYTFHGVLKEHPKYGLQFLCDQYKQESLISKSGLIAYLSSDKFKGIGPKIAERLVDLFQEDTIEAILANDSRMNDVSGLTKDKQKTLVSALQEAQGENHIVLQLLSLGIKNNLAYKVYQYYGQDTLEIVKDDPYQLIETIDGISFYLADAIGMKVGIEADNPKRLKGAIYDTLKMRCFASGNTYDMTSDVLTQSIQMLEKNQNTLISETDLVAGLIEMVQESRVILNDDKLSLPALYYAEKGIANHIDRLLKQDKKSYEIDWESQIESVQKTLRITYEEEQRQAILQAVQHPLSIVTGGPGTGKTTVVKGIIEMFCQINDIDLTQSSYDDESPILLAAPTGRAAKRMKEMTDYPAFTLHRLLGIGITGQDLNGEITPTKLSGKLLIIDEMSMVDTFLMNWVLQSIPIGMHVVLVGDKDQLPSVGPGQVLNDLMSVQFLPTVQLNRVHRQEEDSSIITLAHDVKDGIIQPTLTQNFSDRSYFEASAAQVPLIIEKIVTRAKERGFSMKDIQILAPMYKGIAGIDRINSVVQNILNPKSPKKREIEFGERLFRTGDKVLQLVNQAEFDVFNGDIGEIVSIFYAKETEDKVDEIIVDFDGNEVTYKRSDLNQLTLAYCCSIHKAQGSEYPLVILPMVSLYKRMLKRDVLYTGLTRSKRSLVLCGESSAFYHAINTPSIKRLTHLPDFLLKKDNVAIKTTDSLGEFVRFDSVDSTVFNPSKIDVFEEHLNGKSQQVQVVEQFILSHGNIQLIDPMIGMDNITPFDFMEE